MASGAARGELVTSAAVAAADQFPPAPPTQVRAADRPGDAGGAVVVRWVPSPDDRRRLLGEGVASFTVQVGPGAVHPVQGLSGYRILRWREGEVPGLLASVGPGVAEYVDTTAIDGLRYRYEVRAFDGAGESAAQVEAGSPDDVARIAAAVDNALVPVDAEGRPILGWFERADPTVNLNDFFLLADHYGRQVANLPAGP
ncbi:MAG: fibronectin type III domain-containing protein [Gemmatimonadota bacterium]